MLQPSTTLGGRYILHQKLGAGGMGAVYQATDRLTHDTVALKRVSISGILTPTLEHNNLNFRLALAQEFKTLASLRHPNIISVLDYGFDQEGQPYLTMELLKNASTIVQAGQGQPLTQQIELQVQLLQALAYLHRRGIIHCDLKPANVLVVKGQVKVLDFGLAISLDHLKEKDGDVVGTLAYMPPEIFEYNLPSESTDLYAVGMITYEMFAGQHPFDTKDYASLMSDIMLKVPDIEALNLNHNLAAILKKLLTKDPAQRYADAQKLIKAYAQATNQFDLLAETIAIRESFLQAAQFVGRETELKHLTNALESVRVGIDSAWLIGGESGVGKTRLLDELRIQALAEGLLLLRGQAISDGAAPYQLWREVLRHLCLECDLSDMDSMVLKALIPDIALLLDREVPDAPPLEPQATYERLLTVIESMFVRQTQPLLLILEDLHWASHESLALLNHLSRGRGVEAMMTIASYRDDEYPDLPRTLPRLKLLKLPRLSRENIAQLSESMLGPRGRNPQIIQLLQQETEGNTFFIVEVMRTLAEEAGQLSNISTSALPHKVSTGGIEAVIQHRLQHISPEMYPLLKVAAIAGRALNLKVLEMVDIQIRFNQVFGEAEFKHKTSTVPEADTETSPLVGMPTSADSHPAMGKFISTGGQKKTRPLSLLPGLNQWLNRCAIVTILEVEEDQWRFAHDKLREGLLANLTTEEKQQCHRQVAEALELAYTDIDDHATALAHHWIEAADIPKAAHYTALAGIQTLENGALAEAITWLKQAINFQTQKESKVEADPSQMGRLHHKLAEAYYGLGQPIESRYHLQKTLLYLEHPMPTQTPNLIAALLKQGSIHLWNMLKPGQPSTHPDADLLEIVRAYERLAQIYYVANQTLPALYATLHGFNLAQQFGPGPELAQFYANMVGVYRFARLHFLAEKSSQRSRKIAQQLNDSSVLAWSLFATSILSVGFHTWVELLAALNEAMALFKRLLNNRATGDILVTLGFVYYLQGHFQKGIDTAQTLYQLGLESDNLEHQAWGLNDQVRCLLKQGKIEKSLILLDQLLPLLTTLEQSRITEIQFYGLKAIAHLRQGQYELAQQNADTAAQLLGQSPPSAYSLFEGYATVAEVYLSLWEKSITTGTAAEIKTRQTAASQACRALHKYAALFPVGKPRDHLYQGWFEWLSGHQKRAYKAWQKGLKQAQHLTMPYEGALTYYEMGRHLPPEDLNQQHHINQAIECFEQLGAGYDLTRAKQVLTLSPKNI